MCLDLGDLCSATGLSAIAWHCNSADVSQLCSATGLSAIAWRCNMCRRFSAVQCYWAVCDCVLLQHVSTLLGCGSAGKVMAWSFGCAFVHSLVHSPRVRALMTSVFVATEAWPAR